MARAELPEVALAVVGGGATAAWLLVMLRRELGRLPPTVVIEPRDAIGPGLAYATALDCHRLNVTADKMDMHAVDGVMGFVDWLSLTSGRDAADYVPRALYGRYLSELLGTEMVAQPLTHCRASVTDVRRLADGFEVQLVDGRQVRAASVVLATGNPRSRPLCEPGCPRVIEQPLRGLPALSPHPARILAVGAGLTAMDSILEAHARWPAARFTVVAPHAFFPPADLTTEPLEVLDDGRIPGPATICRRLRERRTNAEGPARWFAAVDGLRPHAQTIWQAWNEAQRRSFLRHAARYWLHLRHRAAPETAGRIAELEVAGQIRLVSGRAEVVDADHRQCHVRIGARESTCDLVVNATGPNLDPGHEPLLARLLERGLVARDALGLGIRVADDGTAKDALDARVEGLFALGVWTRGAFWEVVAIPHIRERIRAAMQPLEAACRRYEAGLSHV